MNKLIANVSVILLLFWGCDNNQEAFLQKELFIKRISVIEGTYMKPHIAEEYQYIDRKVIAYSYTTYPESASGGQIIITQSTNVLKYTYVDNLITSAISTTEKGENFQSKIIYKYNSQNRLIKETIIEMDGTESGSIEYTYGTGGKLIEEKRNFYFPYPVPFYIIKFTYESNNVTKTSYYDVNGVLFGEVRLRFDGKNAPFRLHPAIGQGNLLKVMGTDKYKFVNGLLELKPANVSRRLFSTREQDSYYEYNQWGYPTKQIATFKKENRKIIYSYEYL